MRRYVLDERVIKISQALEPDEKVRKEKIEIHQICNQQKHRNHVTFCKTEPGKKEHNSSWSTSSLNREQRLPQVLQI